MDLTQQTEETLEAIKKATTTGVTSSTGIFGVDLSDLISLIPVNTPFRDALPRKAPKMGAPFATWRVLVDVTSSQPNPSVAFDFAANLAVLSELDVTALYKKVGMGYTVTQDSVDLAGGYADAKAVAIMNALSQFKIGEDKELIGGCNFPLGTPATPVVTTATTGGSIATGTAVNVKVAARSGTNYFWGGSTIASAQGTVTTGAGSTNSATATVTAVKGAMAYDWYVAGFYLTTTTVNTVTITSIPVANQALPALPDLFATAPSAVPVADTSANVNNFNGLVATLAGDYATGGATGLVQPGTGTGSGAYYASLNGSALTSSGQNINELDAMFQSIFDKVRLSPDALMVSSQDGTKISKLLLASGSASSTFYTPSVDGRLDAVAGAFVGHYVNKAAGGVPVKIEVQPHMPPGTIVARTDRVPFPNSNITNTLEVRTLRDVADYEYGVSRQAGAGGGPRWDGETYANETLINRAPVAMGVLSNVG